MKSGLDVTEIKVVAKLSTTFDKVVARNINEEKSMNYMHIGLHFSFFSLILTNLRLINSYVCWRLFPFFTNKRLEKVVASLATTFKKVVSKFKKWSPWRIGDHFNRAL